MTKTRKGFMAIVIALAVIVTGIFGYGLYQEKLENGAYMYLNQELYGTFSDLNVTDVTSVGHGYYDISYTYERDEGRVIRGEHFNVKLL